MRVSFGLSEAWAILKETRTHSSSAEELPGGVHEAHTDRVAGPGSLNCNGVLLPRATSLSPLNQMNCVVSGTFLVSALKVCVPEKVLSGLKIACSSPSGFIRNNLTP